MQERRLLLFLATVSICPRLGLNLGSNQFKQCTSIQSIQSAPWAQNRGPGSDEQLNHLLSNLISKECFRRSIVSLPINSGHTSSPDGRARSVHSPGPLLSWFVQGPQCQPVKRKNRTRRQTWIQRRDLGTVRDRCSTTVEMIGQGLRWSCTDCNINVSQCRALDEHLRSTLNAPLGGRGSCLEAEIGEALGAPFAGNISV